MIVVVLIYYQGYQILWIWEVSEKIKLDYIIHQIAGFVKDGLK